MRIYYITVDLSIFHVYVSVVCLGVHVCTGVCADA